MQVTLEHKLAMWERDARQLVMCVGCYGSGEDRWKEGRACEVCKGAGRSEREPHVVELVTLVRDLLGKQ